MSEVSSLSVYMYKVGLFYIRGRGRIFLSQHVGETVIRKMYNVPFLHKICIFAHSFESEITINSISHLTISVISL